MGKRCPYHAPIMLCDKMRPGHLAWCEKYARKLLYESVWARTPTAILCDKLLPGSTILGDCCDFSAAQDHGRVVPQWRTDAQPAPSTITTLLLHCFGALNCLYLWTAFLLRGADCIRASTCDNGLQSSCDMALTTTSCEHVPSHCSLKYFLL